MKHTMTSKCNKKSLKKSSSKNMWCTDEEVSLRKAILKYGKGKWLKMKQDSLFNVVFKDRTTSDLKDKWRNIERKEKKVKQKAKKSKKNKNENEIKVDDIIPETDNIVPTFSSESPGISMPIPEITSEDMIKSVVTTLHKEVHELEKRATSLHMIMPIFQYDTNQNFDDTLDSLEKYHQMSFNNNKLNLSHELDAMNCVNLITNALNIINTVFIDNVFIDKL